MPDNKTHKTQHVYIYIFEFYTVYNYITIN